VTLWIRIDSNIGDNPNVLKLAEHRGVSAEEIVGLCVILFGKLAEHCPDGDVSNVSDAMLERWASWKREPGAFAADFRRLFVTDGVVEGWAKRQGKLIERAAKEKERWRRRHSAEAPPEHRGGTAEESAARNGTVRNGSKKPANAGKPKQEPAPWMGLMFAAWSFGTLPPGSATILRPVVAAVGEEETARRLAAYCDTVDPRFANVRDFVAKHAVHAEQLGVDPLTGTLNAVGAKAWGGGR
jgi:hypothetical protein